MSVTCGSNDSAPKVEEVKPYPGWVFVLKTQRIHGDVHFWIHLT
jgi:hypothetical protein